MINPLEVYQGLMAQDQARRLQAQQGQMQAEQFPMQQEAQGLGLLQKVMEMKRQQQQEQAIRGAMQGGGAMDVERVGAAMIAGGNPAGVPLINAARQQKSLAALQDQRNREFTRQSGNDEANRRLRERSVVVAEKNAGRDRVPSGYRANPDGSLAFIPGGPADPANKPASAAAQDKQEQKGAMADYAETLISRLETSLSTDPRSTTGMFSPLIRGAEAVTNAVAPGTIGSQATIASQSKEQLLSVLGQIRGGGAGRLSNQDMRRVDTAIGQLSSGTPEGMAQGLKDARELIGAMRGNGAQQDRRKPESKVLNGKTYEKINGKWYEK